MKEPIYTAKYTMPEDCDPATARDEAMHHLKNLVRALARKQAREDAAAGVHLDDVK